MKYSIKAGAKTICDKSKRNKFEKKPDESARQNEENMDPEQLQMMQQSREAKEVGQADLLTKTGSHVLGKTMEKLDPKRVKAASTGKSHEDFMKIEQEKEELEEKSNAKKKELRAKNRKINTAKILEQKPEVNKNQKEKVAKLDQVKMEAYSDNGTFETDDNDNIFWDSPNRFKVDE